MSQHNESANSVGDGEQLNDNKIIQGETQNQGIPRKMDTKSKITQKNNPQPANQVPGPKPSQRKKRNKVHQIQNQNRDTQQNNPDEESAITQASVDLKMLQDLQDADVEDLILHILNNRNQFDDFSKRKNLGSQEIYCLSTLMIFLNDPFTDNLENFVNQISKQVDKSKQEIVEVFECLVKICENVFNMGVASNYQTVRTVLNILKIQIPAFEFAHKQNISDESKRTVENLIHQLLAKGNEKISNKTKKKFYCENSREPPDDFRQISVFPSATEILDNKVFLRGNVIKGPYKDVNHYLDVQFRLLREDFLRPLRSGIQAYRSKSEKSITVDIYKKVKFLHMEPVNEHYCIRLLLHSSKNKKLPNFENSRKLMYGSLVCFTCDNFKTIIFGKICERNLEDLKMGELIIEFDSDVSVMFNVSYVMVECKIYFEPYFQVLKALKNMTSSSFPMEKYIIRLQMDVKPPQYLTEPNCKYKFQNHKFSPLRPWPINNFSSLNESQFLAFRAAMTQEFTVIQGPPGTGKTHLGLLITKTLLDNERWWHKRSPILVLCYTNHALDQFLEGVLAFTNQIIRVGGRSASEKLKKFHLKSLGRIRNSSVWEKLGRLDEIKTKIKEILNSLREIDSYRGVIAFDKFDEVVPHTWFYHASASAVVEWLLEGRENVSKSRIKKTLNKDKPSRATEDDIIDKSSDLSIITLKTLNDEIIMLKKSRSKEEKTEITSKLSDLENKRAYLSMRLAEGKENEEASTEKPKSTNLINPRLMDPDDRWNLYFHWLKLYKENLLQQLNELNHDFQETYKKYDELHNLEITKMLKEALVVGMTTTMAARLRLSLQSVRSPIVIVEEAAEIVESHVVASVTECCQHLILIGDHQQLRPKTADYNIETKFKLGISLFERIIINSDQYYVLNMQHRMRREISCLISPIYPFLEDHPSIAERPRIRGIDSCLFFIDHDNLETEYESTSKINQHEISFFIYLAKYLISNNYEPKNITILTAYVGQMFGFQKEIAKHGDVKDVRVAVLDNYQGEECDIILLSLVRNNNENKIGFLSAENRICVALSRAKNGFYIMGNMTQLCRDNDLWFKVRAILQEQDAIGPKLRLRCQIHPSVVTHVKRDVDFMAIPNGGCNEKCGMVLVCGHVCSLVCHTNDRDHKDYQCEEECNRLLCDQDENHKCKKKCYKKCGPCNYLIQKKLPCGHEAEIECHIPTETYECKIIVTLELACGHTIEKPCHHNPKTLKCVHPCNKILFCGHSCGLSCHFPEDSQHMKYKCKKRCTKYMKDCTVKEEEHKCKKLCYEECDPCAIPVKKQKTTCPHVHEVPCHLDIGYFSCKEPCTETLKCGHQCGRKCEEKCGECDTRVSKVYPVCGHSVKVKCSEEPDRKYCNKKCPLQLPCGHPCSSKCNEPCTINCSVLVDCSILAECGHIITQIKCNMYEGSVFTQEDLKLPSKFCNKRCEVVLKCGHSCSGSCSECCQGRFHKRCERNCITSLICNHRYESPCKQTYDPCTLKCSYKCPHNSCSKKCCDVCATCKKKCPRSCIHQQCTQLCGEICNVTPCQEPCQKILKCGHNCVGFCGDPCPPKCLTCDDKTMRKEDERYVFLNDCKHTIENSRIEDWLTKNKNQFGFNVCPECNTTTMTTPRYSDSVKRTMKDISFIKRQVNGTLKENEEKRQELHRKFFILKQKCEDLNSSLPKVKITLEALESQLKCWAKNKQKPIHKYQLETMISKLDIIENIQNNFNDNSDKHFIFQLNFILNVLKREHEYFTEQEIEDISDEMNRFLRTVEFIQIAKDPTNDEAIKNIITEIKKYIMNSKKFSKKCNDDVRKLLKELKVMTPTKIHISENENIKIFSMAGFKKNSWVKCLNGHIYASGAKCSVCK